MLIFYRYAHIAKAVLRPRGCFHNGHTVHAKVLPGKQAGKVSRLNAARQDCGQLHGAVLLQQAGLLYWEKLTQGVNVSFNICKPAHRLHAAIHNQSNWTAPKLYLAQKAKLGQHGHHH